MITAKVGYVFAPQQDQPHSAFPDMRKRRDERREGRRGLLARWLLSLDSGRVGDRGSESGVEIADRSEQINMQMRHLNKNTLIYYNFHFLFAFYVTLFQFVTNYCPQSHFGTHTDTDTHIYI